MSLDEMIMYIYMVYYCAILRCKSNTDSSWMMMMITHQILTGKLQLLMVST